MEIPTESKISKTFSDRTTKIVIILVLVMLFILPLFQSDTYKTDTTSQQRGLDWIVDMYETKNWTMYQTTVSLYMDFHTFDASKFPLLELNIPDFTQP